MILTTMVPWYSSQGMVSSASVSRSRLLWHQLLLQLLHRVLPLWHQLLHLKDMQLKMQKRS